MRLKYLILLLLPIVAISCKKKQNTNNDGNGNGNGSDEFAYTVAYDSIISTTANVAYNFGFTINVESGDIVGNNLTCALSGLPSSVGVAPDSLVVGRLLGGVFNFSIGNLPLGDYPFLLKIKSTKYGEQPHNVVLRIVPPPNFAPLLAGNYDSCYDYCPAVGFIKYPSVVTTVADTPYLLRISNIQNLGAAESVRALVSNVIIIPAQPIAGKTIWGRGTYSRDARPGHEDHYLMTVSDTLVTGLDTQVCTMHIEH